MSDRHDYLALDWVRGEIQETLNQAQQALESFVDNPDDATRMRFCQTHLHQVYGTLQMVEFYGAALLAEEMEKLAQALLDGNVGNVTDSQETLMRAILQLPPYLDRVASNRRDLPVVLLPLESCSAHASSCRVPSASRADAQLGLSNSTCFRSAQTGPATRSAHLAGSRCHERMGNHDGQDAHHCKSISLKPAPALASAPCRKLLQGNSR